MCIYSIVTLFGRTSNNLICILHALKLSILNNASVDMTHPIFEITNQINTSKCGKEIIDEHSFYYKFDKSITLSEYKDIFKKHVKLKIKKNVKFFDVCFHIRSGDLFTSHNGPSPYIPLPLSFYEKYIEIYKDKNICIVYEDNGNPVVNILEKKYTNITFQSSDLLTDIYTLANCKTLIISSGTFFLTSFCISNSIEKIIYPEYTEYFFNTSNWGVETEKVEFPNYMKVKDWTSNNKEKLDLILTYKF